MGQSRSATQVSGHVVASSQPLVLAASRTLPPSPHPHTLFFCAVTGKCSGNTDTSEDHTCMNGSLVAAAATRDRGSDAEANCCEGSSCMVGDAVEAVWAGDGAYYSATITDITGDSITVDWTDGSTNHRTMDAMSVRKEGVMCTTGSTMPHLHRNTRHATPLVLSLPLSLSLSLSLWLSVLQHPRGRSWGRWARVDLPHRSRALLLHQHNLWCLQLQERFPLHLTAIPCSSVQSRASAPATLIPARTTLA